MLKGRVSIRIRIRMRRDLDGAMGVVWFEL
jgi:hypothetical protein